MIVDSDDPVTSEGTVWVAGAIGGQADEARISGAGEVAEGADASETWTPRLTATDAG